MASAREGKSDWSRRHSSIAARNAFETRISKRSVLWALLFKVLDTDLQQPLKNSLNAGIPVPGNQKKRNAKPKPASPNLKRDF
jgi:hypothetical protein